MGWFRSLEWEVRKGVLCCLRGLCGASYEAFRFGDVGTGGSD